jgi:hypothetical protein
MSAPLKRIVFDIETRNVFADVGKAEPALLDISIVGIYDSATDSYHSFTVEELPRLWPFIERAHILIGYNSDHFDIPLLQKYYPGKLSALKSVDILREIKNASGKRLRLDAVAEGTLGVKKSGHGMDAIRWWKEGAIEKIREYCLNDVKLTKELYDYARVNGLLKYKDLSDVREIKLDTSAWETLDVAPTLTHTLPF